jgi:hypothetical protein
MQCARTRRAVDLFVGFQGWLDNKRGPMWAIFDSIGRVDHLCASPGRARAIIQLSNATGTSPAATIAIAPVEACASRSSEASV